MSIYYQDDMVTLYHGDALTETAWLSGDVLVTDPPYGIAFSRHGKNAPAYAGEDKRSRAADREIPAEDVSLRNTALAAWGYERPALIFGSWRAPRPPRTQNRLVWAKGAPTSGGAGPWRPSEEEIYLTGWKTKKHRDKGDDFSLNVIQHRNEHHGKTSATGRPHPSVKPTGLLEHLITFCPPGVVADPFAGSGSTLIAARNLGRHAIGVEIDEKYCEVAALRLSNQPLLMGVFE